jgi:apolipoprotein N-acyltransferase
MKKQPYLWLGLFALLILLASGRFSWTGAAWMAPIFGLRFLQTAQGNWRRRSWHIYLALWLPLSVAWYGATPIWGAAHFIFMGVMALFSILPYLLHEWMGQRLRPSFLSTLTFPLAVVSVEMFTVGGSPLGNFGAEGYAQYGFLPLMQLTAVTGMLGMSFVVAWFGSTVQWAWSQAEGRERWQRGALVYAAVLAIVLGSGAVRLFTAPPVQASVPVTGLTAATVNLPELMPLFNDDLAGFRAKTQAIHAEYLAESERAAAQGAKILLWPEGAGIGVPEDVAGLMAQAAGVAQTHGLYLALPTFTLDPTGQEQAVNQMQILDPQGEIVLTHVKFGGNFIEGTLAGDGILRTVDTPYGTLAAAICWDADFPGVIAQAGAQGVDILLSPANDWAGIDPLHGHMSAFRAVENGLTVVRQSDGGLSLITDPYGRALAQGSGPIHQQSALVSTAGIPTLFPTVGDSLGWLALAGLAVLVVRRRWA